MQVDEPGDHRLAGRIDDFRGVRHLDGVARTGRPHASVVDQDDRVGDGVAAPAVDELGAHDCQIGGLCVRRRSTATGSENRGHQERDN